MIDAAIRVLWNGSKVRAFVAVLAMRQVRARQGMSEKNAGEDLEASA